MTSEVGSPLGGAQISVTSGPTRLVKTAISGADGSWELRFPDGSGDYLVHVAMPQRKTFRKRVTRPAGSTDSLFVVDAVLELITQQLQEVVVEGTRPKPVRADPENDGPGTGAREEDAQGVVGAVQPEANGDLAVLAATTPGIDMVTGGVSALGLGAEQSQVTLGGLGTSLKAFPADVRKTVRVSTSTYDPSRGWFSGAQIAAELSPGSTFASRNIHLRTDPPQLQFTDAAGRALGQQVTALQGSFAADGGFANDRWTYNTGLEVSRRTSDAPSLETAPRTALAVSGLNPDLAQRALGAAASAGIPARDPEASATNAVSFIARVDRARIDMRTYEPARRTYGFVAFAQALGEHGLGIAPTGAASRAARGRDVAGGVQAQYSGYVGKRDWLTEVRSGFSARHDNRRPIIDVPAALVTLSSEDLASSATVPVGPGPIAFGGNGLLTADESSWLWETQAQLRLFPPRRVRHELMLSTGTRLDALRATALLDENGTYTYNSLGDLTAGTPAAFSRTVSGDASPTRVANAYVALGDQWRASNALRVLYGVRLEGNRYLTHPARNTSVESAFGVRTDRVPNSLGVSPRLGFTWTVVPASGEGNYVSSLGQFRLSPGKLLRGGVGEFRNILGPDAVDRAANATGLPSALREIMCVGSSVPTPQWSAWASGSAALPTACAAGDPAQQAVAPSVFALSPHFTAPRSWRGNLAWSAAWGRLAYQLEGIYSLNVNQPSTQDVNFSGVERFAVTGEARPVYVAPSAIEPGTGALAPTDARSQASFGSVRVQAADARSVSRQLTLSLAPAHPSFGRWYLSGSYTIGSTRAIANGFDGSTFGDPRQREWARAALDVRHRFLAQGGYSHDGFGVTFFGRALSGRPFTPIIGSDVNGDGLVNDRAFAFSPTAVGSTAPDSALKAQTIALVARAPRYVRECLARSFNHAARVNSCDGPWTASLNARIDASGARLGLGDRMNIALYFSNILGGVDQLLHGSRIQGWGEPAFPDPVLYRVRGFDQGAQRFVYEVNPRFGDARPAASVIRTPFAVTIDIHVDVGRGLDEQMLDKSLRAGRRGRPGPRLSAENLRQRYAANVPNPYDAVLAESDSLLLTRDQVTRLQEARDAYQIRVDSIWNALATDLAGLGDEYDVDAALRRQEDAMDAAWELTRLDIRERMPEMLTNVQQALAPWPVPMLLGATRRMHYRVYHQ